MGILGIRIRAHSLILARHLNPAAYSKDDPQPLTLPGDKLRRVSLKRLTAWISLPATATSGLSSTNRGTPSYPPRCPLHSSTPSPGVKKLYTICPPLKKPKPIPLPIP